jgi:hypothetical protein
MTLSYDSSKKCFLVDGAPLPLDAPTREGIQKLHWYQSIPLAPDFSTPGSLPILDRLRKYRLDELQFTGKRVLGIGCYEGFELLWAKAHGAGYVAGVADDFLCVEDITATRRSLQTLFPATIDWIEERFETLDPTHLEQFDIVLVCDGLVHTRDPLSFLEKATQLCRSELVLLTPFVLGNQEIPWVTHFPRFSPTGAERDVCGPNETWLFHSLHWFGFKVEDSRSWEHDFASIYARRSWKREHGPELQPLADEPLDDAESGKTAVLMISCERYQQVWRPFFTLFARYWPECPYPIYLGTNKGSYPGVVTLQTGDDGGAKMWAARLKSVLASLPVDRVILLQEDFLLSSPANNRRIRQLVQHSFDYDVASIRLLPVPPPRSAWYGSKDLGVYGAFEEFRLSLQATIWNRELLIGLLSDGEDPWVTEFVGTRRAQFYQKPFLGVFETPLPYYCTAVIRGEWEDGALELLKREDISLEGITKKI